MSASSRPERRFRSGLKPGVVKDEEPEFEDGESDDSTENSTETTDSTETN